MARFNPGGRMGFEAAIFGAPNPNTYRFLMSQFDNPSHHLVQADGQYHENLRDIIEEFHGEGAQLRYRSLSRALDNHWQPNEFRILETTAHLQYAPSIMQRYLMAEPLTRQYYHARQLEGFSDSYVDYQPGVIGVEHHDWRRVMNGTLVETDEGFEFATYMDDLPDGEEELAPDQQDIVQSTWLHAVAHIQRALANREDVVEDFTSTYNAKLRL